MLSQLINPAIVVALLGGALSLVGLFIKSIIDTREQSRLRRERRDDMQKAIKAEIRSFLAMSVFNDLDHFGEQVIGQILREDFYPYIIQDRYDFVYRSLIQEIYYLPAETIGDITDYYISLASIAFMKESMGSKHFLEISKERRALIYSDYIATLKTAERQGLRAIECIEIYEKKGSEGVLEYKSALVTKHNSSESSA